MLGCSDAPPAAKAPTATATATGTVDSIFPMDVMIDRFQRSMPEAPTNLQEPFGVTVWDLMDRMEKAVESGDSVGLDRLRITPAEFAFLYFPTSINARKPYEQPPATAWQLVDLNSMKGRQSLMRKLGNGQQDLKGPVCEKVSAEGANRLWECRVLVTRPAGGTDTLRVTGSIIERDNRFKFVSFANRL